MLIVPTAVADDAQPTLTLVAQLADRAELSYLPFFPWPPPNLRELLLEQDAIWVNGGNTANLLAIWRLHGVDEALREAWRGRRGAGRARAPG